MCWKVLWNKGNEIRIKILESNKKNSNFHGFHHHADHYEPYFFGSGICHYQRKCLPLPFWLQHHERERKRKVRFEQIPDFFQAISHIPSDFLFHGYGWISLSGKP